jgi:DNA adenine methylase
MPFYTPLRYPGGKRRLAPLVAQLLDQNNLTNIDYVEAYAGGAAIALALLFSERAATVHMNDLSRAVYAFWHTVLNDTSALCRRIEQTRISMKEWHRQRAVYQSMETSALPDLGFAALFLNRTNRSGILSGGVIGGQKQTGDWALDARFNKTELIHRIKRVGRYRSRINLYQQDALTFTQKVLPSLGPKAFAFYDPPYIENGEDLYLNNYDLEGHKKLATGIAQAAQPWVVTYDYAAVKCGLYPSHRRMIYGLNYSAQDRYAGREVMFFADSIRLPEPWMNAKRILMSPAESRYPVYGKMENMPSVTRTRTKKKKSAARRVRP